MSLVFGLAGSMLVDAARRRLTSQQAADTIFDAARRFGFSARDLSHVLNQPTLEDSIIAAFPVLSPHREWLDQIAGEVRNRLGRAST